MKRTSSDLNFCIAIASYGNEPNLPLLLEQVERSWRVSFRPEKIYILADLPSESNLKDIQEFERKSQFEVVLDVSTTRRGKARAINAMLEAAKGVQAVLLISADVLPMEGTLLALMEAVGDPEVGVAAGRVFVSGEPCTWASRVTAVHWDLHHQLALISPKSTEITAFKNDGVLMNPLTLVDEADIERQLTDKGYKVVYLPQSSILANSPASISEYFRMRFRVTVGHMILHRMRGYRIGSLDLRGRLLAIKRHLLEDKVDVPALGLLLFVESLVLVAALARVLVSTQSSGKWKRIEGTKKEIEELVGRKEVIR